MVGPFIEFRRPGLGAIVIALQRNNAPAGCPPGAIGVGDIGTELCEIVGRPHFPHQILLAG